jgi:hypothetical protein
MGNDALVVESLEHSSSGSGTAVGGGVVGELQELDVSGEQEPVSRYRVEDSEVAVREFRG